MMFTPKLGPWGLVGRYALMFSVVAFLFALLFLFDSVPVVILAGASMGGLMLWSLYHMHRQKFLRGWFLAFMLLGCVMLVLVVITRVMRVTEM